MEEDPYKIYSGKSEFEELLNSIPWWDIVNNLENWKLGFENELKTLVQEAKASKMTNTAFLLQQGDLDGRIKLIDYIIKLPEVLMNEVEERKK